MDCDGKRLGEASFRAGRRGFTLTEMLAALVIFSLLGLALTAMLSTSLATWQKDGTRDERRLTARRSLDLMAQDLRLAALPANRSDTGSIQVVIDPPGTDMSSYLVPHAFFGQAPVATDFSSASNRGDLAIFGYFVRWVGTEACLCRLLINPSSPDYGIYSKPNSWLTTTLLNEYAPASTAQSYAGFVGENVLGLWVQAIDVNGNAIVTPASGSTTTYANGAYDSRLGYSISNSGTTTVYPPSVLPSAVRLGLVVIDNATAERITVPIRPTTPTTNFDGDIQQFVTNLPGPIQKGAEVFTENVALDHFSP